MPTELLRLDGETGESSQYLLASYTIPGMPAGDRVYRVDLPPDSAIGVLRPNYLSIIEATESGHIDEGRSFRLELGAHFRSPVDGRLVSDNEALFNFQSARTLISNADIFEIRWDSRIEQLTPVGDSVGAMVIVKTILESETSSPIGLASFVVGKSSPDCAFLEIADISGTTRRLSFPRDEVVSHNLTWTTANNAIGFSIEGPGVREGYSCERSPDRITMQLARVENPPRQGRFRIEMKSFRLLTDRVEPSYDPANPDSYVGTRSASYNFDNVIVDRK